MKNKTKILIASSILGGMSIPVYSQIYMCKTCPANTYSNGSQCVPCGQYQYSNAGSSSCTDLKYQIESTVASLTKGGQQTEGTLTPGYYVVILGGGNGGGSRDNKYIENNSGLLSWNINSNFNIFNDKFMKLSCEEDASDDDYYSYTNIFPKNKYTVPYSKAGLGAQMQYVIKVDTNTPYILASGEDGKSDGSACGGGGGSWLKLGNTYYVAGGGGGGVNIHNYSRYRSPEGGAGGGIGAGGGGGDHYKGLVGAAGGASGHYSGGAGGRGDRAGGVGSGPQGGRGGNVDRTASCHTAEIEVASGNPYGGLGGVTSRDSNCSSTMSKISFKYPTCSNYASYNKNLPVERTEEYDCDSDNNCYYKYCNTSYFGTEVCSFNEYREYDDDDDIVARYLANLFIASEDTFSNYIRNGEDGKTSHTSNTNKFNNQLCRNCAKIFKIK
ncbi:MAG: hypothetical protein ACI4N3_00255 [Alphaproteobacteria bacterium]